MSDAIKKSKNASVAGLVLFLAVGATALHPAASFGEGSSSPSEANGGESCSLPVCDIDAKLTELRAMGMNQRYAVYTDLWNRFESSRSIPVLENLLAFGRRAKELSVELKDEDWVIRTAQSLIDTSLVTLVKVDASSGELLVSRYREIGSQDNRFAILDYWTRAVQTVEEKSVLDALLPMASTAYELALPLDNTRYQYVLSQTRTLLSAITSRMMDLDPYLEGVYEITLHYSQDKNVPARMVVIDPKDGNGFNLSVAAPDSSDPAFFFSGVNFSRDFSLLIGSSYFRNVPSAVSFHFDRSDGTVKGKIRDTRIGKDVPFTGRLTQPLSEFVSEELPLSERLTVDQLEGIYRGELAGLPGNLIIKRISEREIGGSFMSDNGNVTLHFQKGKFIQKTGAFTGLMNVFNPTTMGKIALRIRKSKGVSVQMNGTGFLSRSSMAYKISFVRVGDVDPVGDFQ